MHPLKHCINVRSRESCRPKHGQTEDGRLTYGSLEAVLRAFSPEKELSII